MSGLHNAQHPASASTATPIVPPLKCDDDDTKSRIGDEYILVKKSKAIPIPTKDEKVNDPGVGLAIPKLSSYLSKEIEDYNSKMKMKNLLRSSRPSGSKVPKGDGPEVAVKLFRVPVTVTSAAGGAIAQFFALSPSAATEWAQYALLYDEARVDGVTFEYAASQEALTANPCQPYAVGYDPLFGTIPASVADVRESTQSQWGIQGIGVASINCVQTVGNGQEKGTRAFHITMPKKQTVLTDPGTTTNNFPGSWMSCLDAADTVGYMRVRFDAPGGTNVTQLRYMITYHVRFRIRT